MLIASAGPEQRRSAAALLARAFDDDPAANLLFATSVRRISLERLFLAELQRRDVLVEVGISALTEELIGCAIWADGGSRRRPGPDIGGLLQALALLRAPVAAVRMALAAPALERLGSRFAPPGAVTLVAVGIVPPLRGAGYGSSLLQSGLRRLDAAGLPCYLETVNPRSVRFHERHGFRVVGEVTPRGSLRTLAMVREAGRGGADEQGFRQA